MNIFSKKTKLASIATTSLLLLSGIFTVLTILPVASVQAAGPSVTVSPTSGVVGARLTITVTGFAASSSISIYFDTWQTSPYSTVLRPAAALSSLSTTNGIASLISALSADTDPGNPAGTACNTQACYKTDADGNFQLARQTVPTLAGGAHTLTVTDGTNKATTTFTVSSSLVIKKYQTSCSAPFTSTTLSLSSGFAGQSWSGLCIGVNGFAPGDTVSFSTAPFTAAPSSCTAGSSSTSSVGSCVVSTSTSTLIFAQTGGGAASFTATGSSATGCGSAACTATKTITVNPAIALYASQNSVTEFSFIGTSPTSLLLEGYGFPASTSIAANSITVGGITTSHGAISVDSNGRFGLGGGNHIVIAPSSSIPLGLTSIVIPGATSSGSATFGYSQGNVILYQSIDSAGRTLPDESSSTAIISKIYQNVGSASGIAFGWGNPIISSVKPSTAGTVVTTTDATSYNPLTSSAGGYASNAAGTAKDTNVVLFGWGSAVASVALSTITVPSSVGGLAWSSMPSADANGAFFAISSGAVTDSYVSSTSQGVSVTITAPTSVATVVLPASFSIAPWAYLTTGSSSNPDSVNFNSAASSVVFEAHGLQAGLSTTVTVDGSSVTATGASTGSSTSTTPGAFTGATLTFPDLAFGSHTVKVSDGTWSASDAAFTLAAVAAATAGSSTNAALSSNSGGAGSSTTLRTGTTYGVHGLKASTTYSLYWGLTATTSIATFTTNSKGQISAPGITFTVPSGTVGNHILVIKDSTGTDVLFNQISANGVGNPIGSAGVGSATYQSSQSASLTGQYFDLLFSLTVSLTVSPTVGNVGSTLTVGGSGLSATTTYYLTASTSGSGATTSAGSTAYGSFTSDASGNVPSATTFAFPALPTSGSSGYPEQGTTYYIYASTASQYQGGTSTGSGTFVLQSLATLSSSSASAGGTVTLTATGLVASATYAIILNYVVNAQATSYTGLNVGAFTASSSTGGGSLAFTVPSTYAAGTYTIQLVRLSGCSGCSSALGVLATPPTLTVGAAATGNLGTSTFVASGSATEAVVSGYATVTQSFTNTYTGSLSVFMWVSVMNSAGQTVGVFIGSATAASGATVTIGAPITGGSNGVPPGTYTASIFLTTTSGTVVSTTSTTSSFTV